jgi:hypothetical protein
MSPPYVSEPANGSLLIQIAGMHVAVIVAGRSRFRCLAGVRQTSAAVFLWIAWER